MLVLMEEIGELSEAVRRGEREAAIAELADVAFMALCMGNVLGADIESRIRAKFLERGEAEVTRSWTDVPTGEPLRGVPPDPLPKDVPP